MEILPGSDAVPPVLAEAMRYLTLAGGKRLRPAMALAAAEAVGGGWEDVAEVACAIELIHTYSLIHDDLPAMDDDDMRRGMPSCHVRFGEATAILAGDALLTLAFETLAAMPRRDRAAEAGGCVARAAGWAGMVGGQQLDMEAEKKGSVTVGDVLAIHSRKTAALIAASVEGAAIACGAPDGQRAALRRFGEQAGLAFQIADDILDETSPAEKLGKTPGKDREQNKATYVKAAGLDGARAAAAERCLAAKAELEKFGERAAALRMLADYIVERTS
ncbi:MAG: polyprenyl synthetase family protein [Planctomycetota bacterium]|nr:polyprenyl synthetase family protein [Planctomycetota bacterium]